MLFERIKYFVTIADCNSFTEAAERCYISQSAISQQITALEADLGVKLFRRKGRSFELTAAGEYFYKRGKVILGEVEDLKTETARIGEDDELNLSIGYLASYDGWELTRAIGEFSKTYPEVTISVFKDTHEGLYDALRKGRASLVLNDQRRAFSDEYENYVLSQSPAYVEFSFDHPLAKLEKITTAELEKYPCILVAAKKREISEQDFYENTLGIGKIFIFAESLDDARLMALSGRGFMLVERVKKENGTPLLSREVVRSDGSPIVRRYCAFWKKNKTNYYIEEFAAMLRKNFTE